MTVREKTRKGTCREERYLAPKNAKTNGRPKRLKSSKEKAMRKARLWGGCGRRNVAHDMRNCPMIVKSPIDRVSGNDGSILKDEDKNLIECEGLERAISDDGTLTQI